MTDRHGLVLRRDPGANLRRVRPLDRVPAARGGRGGRRARARRSACLLEPDDDLGRGFVMDRVDGETIPRRILRDDELRRRAPAPRRRSAATIAARIHAVDPDDAAAAAGAWAPRAQIDQYRALLDAFGEPHPAFELGLRWLDEHVPPTRRPARARARRLPQRQLHRRPRRHPRRPRLGARAPRRPVEDLGWLCVKSWRFGDADQLVGGFGSLDDLLAAYADAGGATVDEDALRFWVVLGTVKWGVICVGQAFTHLNGLVRSVELADARPPGRRDGMGPARAARRRLVT